jgi:hypothetical protein
MTTGALSSALDGGPDPAFAARVGQSVASARPATQARAANPAPAVPAAQAASVAVPAAAPAVPSPAGVWQVQAGAFRNTLAAEAHLRALESSVPELARLSAVHQLRDGVNRVRIAGIEDEAAARRLCQRILAIGRGCFVVRPRKLDGQG